MENGVNGPRDLAIQQGKRRKEEIIGGRENDIFCLKITECVKNQNNIFKNIKDEEK